jgi:imidazolonepropionase-like amidohydrolase
MARKLFLILLPVLAVMSVIADEPAPQPTLALMGALIRTQTEAGDFVGSVIIRDGKIVSVAKNVDVPAGAKVIDASKCVITPGLIDAHGTIGLNPAAASETGRDATLDILDAVDPFSDDWRDAARQGVTAVYVQPAAGGNLGGSGAVLRVCFGDCAESIALRAKAGVQVALGTTPQAPAAANNQLADLLRQRGINMPNLNQPAAPPPASTTLTRFAQYEQVRAQFDAAKRYPADKPTRPEPPKELLAHAIKGEVPVRIEIHHEDDLRNALRLANEFGLNAIYEHVERAKPFPEEFAKSSASLVIGGKLSGDLSKLALDGRKFAIGTFGSEPRDTVGLRFQAAAAVAAGIPRDKVLKAITSDAADLLGVGDKLGRIAAGRPADLVVFAGDPLDLSAPVRMTISQGKVTYEAPTAEIAPTPKSENPSVPDKLPASYVLKTTRLLNSSGEFAPGELHVIDGKLSARNGNGATLPVFDLGDAPVTPGLVAAHVSVGGELAPDADASQLRAVDGLAADDAKLRSHRDHGFLTAVVAPGSNNVLAGTIAAIRASDETPAPDLGMKFVLTAAARSAERFPVSLAGQFELIDSRLRFAPSDTNMYLPPAVRSALLAQRDQSLQAVRDRRLLACFEAQTRAEIRAALRLIAEHKLRGTLLLPRDVDELIDEIGQANVAVVLPPVKPKDSERVAQGLVALCKTGAPIAFGGDAGDIRTSATWLVNNGLPRNTARRALVGQPAEAIGLPAATGRLQPGDAADFVVWTGDPLDIASRPAAVVVNGERVVIGEDDDAPATDRRRPAAAPARTGRRGR